MYGARDSDGEIPRPARTAGSRGTGWPGGTERCGRRHTAPLSSPAPGNEQAVHGMAASFGAGRGIRGRYPGRGTLRAAGKGLGRGGAYSCDVCAAFRGSNAAGGSAQLRGGVRRTAPLSARHGYFAVVRGPEACTRGGGQGDGPGGAGWCTASRLAAVGGTGRGIPFVQPDSGTGEGTGFVGMPAVI